MTARGKLVTVAVLVGFVAFLLWTTLSAQRYECSVSVEFQGRRGAGSASGASESDALREAQTAACGPLTGSMNDAIACSRVEPVTRQCRSL
jgi:hypothetical protein